MNMSRRNLLAAGGDTAIMAMVSAASSSFAQSAATKASLDLRTTSDTLGADARQAMIDIFRKKDPTAVERYFAESFVQHDPNLADGLAGMKPFAAEIASSPAADITIYRTLVDGDSVLLHSRYEGVGRYAGPAIAFDLFRFNDGKIVERWGGQESETPPNPSGRTQVDGPTEVLDREKTEANRTLVRTYRETVMVALRFDRIEEFIEDAHYAQHASKIGDGISQLRDRIASVANQGGQLHLTPRRFLADGNFVLVLSEGDLPSGPTALYDLFRVQNGKIVEHWDVLAPIPPQDQRKNPNEQFWVANTVQGAAVISCHDDRRRRWLAYADRERAPGSPLPGAQVRGDRKQATRLIPVLDRL
jgi:predicted SnoaL-like aldol condensation-catalyzing enzyme